LWVTGALLAVVLVPLLWSWLAQPVGQDPWTWAGAALALAAVLLLSVVVRAAVTVLTHEEFDSFQELAQHRPRPDARSDLSQPQTELWPWLDDQTKSLPDVRASTFGKFVEQREALLRKVKSRADQQARWKTSRFLPGSVAIPWQVKGSLPWATCGQSAGSSAGSSDCWARRGCSRCS
jgi:hypothetical protein